MASIAAFSVRTLSGICQERLSHLRKTLRHESGRPPIETKVLGMKGRSWREAARIPYSWANITAEANSADRWEAWLPTILASVC